MLYIFIFTLFTTISLLLGLLSMASGKKYGTKLMSLRVGFQATAILSLVIAYFSS